LRQREGVECVLHGHEDVLPAVQLIGDGTVSHFAPGVKMPQRPAIGGIEGEQVAGGISREQQVAGGISREQQVAGGGQDTSRALAFTELVIPYGLPSAIVEGSEGGLLHRSRSRPPQPSALPVAVR